MVGAEIAPGRYFTNPRRGCYWKRLAAVGLKTVANKILAFDSPQEIVDIVPSDRAFNTNENCGTWSQTPKQAPPAGTIPPGTWLVGEQIAPGLSPAAAAAGEAGVDSGRLLTDIRDALLRIERRLNRDAGE